MLTTTPSRINSRRIDGVQDVGRVEQMIEWFKSAAETADALWIPCRQWVRLTLQPQGVMIRLEFVTTKSPDKVRLESLVPWVLIEDATVNPFTLEIDRVIQTALRYQEGTATAAVQP